MKYCQKCGNKLDNGAEFCSKCGQAVVNINNVATKFCSNCGSKIPATASFCTNCGTEITVESKTDSNLVPVDKPYNENIQPDPISSFILFFKDTFHISKRLGRADYWWARLTSLIIGLTLSLFWVSAMVRSIGSESAGSSILTIILIIISFVFGIWYMIALITAGVRRLHDIGLSGAFMFLMILPSIGEMILFIMTLLPSKQANNRYAK